MTNIIDIQYASDIAGLPDKETLSHWVDSALQNETSDLELTLRIVDLEEGATLNEQWRKGSGATNVLSFPSDIDVEIELRLLGDIVICAPIIEREAEAQGKKLMDHWAHIVIHGTLHLLGYDHIEDNDASSMEAMEINILKTLKIDNPYKS
ncbi:MAG: rRNA maturation RNase YbeY [Gammaproteobacteria bacterium]|nr:rRNA maturation RNase YbeY [Gammaproteobacteria bacterium]